MFKKLLLENKFSKDVVSILDIGSSKIICLIARINSSKIEVLGSGCHSANGFRNGNISDPKQAKFSIIAAIDQAEKAANLTIDRVIVTLNGNKISSSYLSPSISIKKQKITNREVNFLTLNAVREVEKLNREVIHYFHLKYHVDENNHVKNPCGLIGNKITVDSHFITIPSIMLENIINCLASCQLDIEDCIFAPYAAGIATLSENDKEFGSTIIDFGDSITSYALFSQNNLVHCGFIPIGSKAITNDIAKSFMLDIATAERIKTIYGAASVDYADNQKMINYKVEGAIFSNFELEEKSISNAELNEVINARIEEIFYLLKQILEKQYLSFPNAQHNVVLTGGGSLLTGISNEASKILRAKVRIGRPVSLTGMNEDLSNASYAAAIGSLLISNKNKSSSNFPNGLSFANKILDWIKFKF